MAKLMPSCGCNAALFAMNVCLIKSVGGIERGRSAEPGPQNTQTEFGAVNAN
jgi:hypothetical protein